MLGSSGSNSRVLVIHAYSALDSDGRARDLADHAVRYLTDSLGILASDSACDKRAVVDSSSDESCREHIPNLVAVFDPPTTLLHMRRPFGVSSLAIATANCMLERRRRRV